MKGYVLLDLHSREIFVSRHVIFHEHILPYQNSPSNPISSWSYMPSDSPTIIDPTPPSHSVTTPLVNPSPIASHSLPTRHSSRLTSHPSYLHDYICNTSTAPKHASKSCLYPITDYMSFSNLSNAHRVLSLSISTQIEPKTYAEASRFDCWIQAMNI
jgi:hypothetical protein